MAVKKGAAKATVAANGKPTPKKPVPKDAEEEMDTLPAAGKRKIRQQIAKTTPAKKTKKSASDDDYDDMDSETEKASLKTPVAVKKKGPAVTPAAKATPAAKLATPAAKLAPATPAAKPNQLVKQPEAKDEDDEEEDDDDLGDEDDDDDEELDGEVDESDGDYDSVGGGSDNELSGEEEDKTQEVQQKAEQDDGLSLFIGSIGTDTKNDRETKIKAFFSAKGITINSFNSNPRKRFCFVGVTSAADKEKALALNGSDFEGIPIKIVPTAKPTVVKKVNPYTEKSDAAASAGKVLIMFGVKNLTEEEVIQATGCMEALIFDTKGIAFLTFDDSEAAQKVLTAAPIKIKGFAYNMEVAKPRSELLRQRGSLPGRGGARGGRGGFRATGDFRGGRGGARGGFRGGRGAVRGAGRGGRGGRQDQGRSCFNCGNADHIAKDCPKPRTNPAGVSDDKCRNCHESGHFAKNCPKPQTCRKCGKEGHIAIGCIA